MSPVQLLIAFIHGGIHPLTNRLPHTWYGEQVKCFLNCRPVFFGNQNGFVPLTHDDDWLVGLGGLVNQPIKVAARLSCCDSGHDAPLACLTFHQSVRLWVRTSRRTPHITNDMDSPCSHGIYVPH